MLLGIVCMNFVLFVLAKIYYVKRNQTKDKAWNNMSEDQKILGCEDWAFSLLTRWEISTTTHYNTLSVERFCMKRRINQFARSPRKTQHGRVNYSCYLMHLTVSNAPCLNQQANILLYWGLYCRRRSPASPESLSAYSLICLEMFYQRMGRSGCVLVGIWCLRSWSPLVRWTALSGRRKGGGPRARSDCVLSTCMMTVITFNKSNNFFRITFLVIFPVPSVPLQYLLDISILLHEFASNPDAMYQRLKNRISWVFHPSRRLPEALLTEPEDARDVKIAK